MTNDIRENESILFQDAAFPIIVAFEKYCLRTPPARHPQVEIKYFVSGECDIVLDDQTIVAREGDVVITSPFQRHYTYSTEGACRYHLLNFDLDFLKGERICDIDTEFLIPFREGRLRPSSILRDGDSGYAEATELFHVLAQKGPFYQLAVKTAIMRLFCVMMQARSYSIVSDKEWQSEKKYGELLRPALQYIEAHYRESITSEELARICNYNSKYFCKVFRQYTSKTPMDYVNSYRLHNAELDLISTDLPLSEIAVNNGFFDAAHLSHCYKKARGFPPSKMRHAKNRAEGN